MANEFNVCFIGAGNLAWHLAPALDNLGFAVKEVFSRTPESAEKLVKRLYHAQVARSLDFSESSCQLYFLTVSDNAIEEVATELILPENAIVVHTSGTQPLSLLGYLAVEDIGVFYPLQTFSKGVEVDFANIPIFLEAETGRTFQVLQSIGTGLSKNVNRLGTVDRKILHLAAVFCCNFSNHLISLSEDLLESKGLDREYLHPLILETIQKAIKNGARESQTGPAFRNDGEVIQQHLQLLAQKEDMLSIYEILTHSIMNYHHPREE